MAYVLVLYAVLAIVAFLYSLVVRKICPGKLRKILVQFELFLLLCFIFLPFQLQINKGVGYLAYIFGLALFVSLRIGLEHLVKGGCDGVNKG